MALTSAYPWKDYSSACGCSTGSSRRADLRDFHDSGKGEPTMTDRHAELDTALERVISAARDHLAAVKAADGEAVEPVESVGEALLELMQAGDGSLGALDIPELESLNGVVVVAEVSAGLDPESFEDVDGTGPFQLEAGDRLVDRLDEHAYV